MLSPFPRVPLDVSVFFFKLPVVIAVVLNIPQLCFRKNGLF